MRLVTYDPQTYTKMSQATQIIIYTGTTVGFRNSIEFIKAFHPKEAVETQQFIMDCLVEYSKLGSTGLPSVPDIAEIRYPTPYGLQVAVILSVMHWIGSTRRGVATATFRTVVCCVHELDAVLDEVCDFANTLPAMLDYAPAESKRKSNGSLLKVL